MQNPLRRNRVMHDARRARRSRATFRFGFGRIGSGTGTGENGGKRWKWGKVHNNALYFTIESRAEGMKPRKNKGQELEMLVTRVMGSCSTLTWILDPMSTPP